MRLSVSSLAFHVVLLLSQQAAALRGTIGGEFALCGRDRPTTSYPVDRFDLDHDAVMRIGGETP